MKYFIYILLCIILYTYFITVYYGPRRIMGVITRRATFKRLYLSMYSRKNIFKLHLHYIPKICVILSAITMNFFRFFKKSICLKKKFFYY